MLTVNDYGLYCPAGDFYIDPWRPVGRAVITHAHADHARPGSAAYLCAAPGAGVLRLRLGDDAHIQPIPFREPVLINGVTVAFHPAGHILGSAQVRLEFRGEVWVVSGDYKTVPDPTCEAFETVRCHTFVTEATFGLPIYRWPEQTAVFDALNRWWRANQLAGRASLVYAYSLGKAQRVLAGLDPNIGPIYAHGAVHSMSLAYSRAGIPLPDWQYVGDALPRTDWSQAMIIAPTSAQGTPWLRRFGDVSAAFASGWMRVRGQRRRRSVDRGFVLSDHVDWPALQEAIAATGAERVLVTHGYIAQVVRWLRENGVAAYDLETRFSGEEEADEPPPPNRDGAADEEGQRPESA